MIMQLPDIVLDCPVCGRPVEIQNQHLDRELACDHCAGQFVVCENEDGKPVAAAHRSRGPHHRAEGLLPTTRVESRCLASEHATPTAAVADSMSSRDVQSVGGEKPGEDCHKTMKRQAMALLVEHRDEVYARLAADMAATGMRVVRATTAVEALKSFGRCEPDQVVANLDLPDQSGWLLACKLRFCQPDIHVWLYQSDASDYDGGMAKYLQVNEVLNYGGDLLGLSETIVEMIAAGRMLFAEECSAEQVAEATVA